MTASFVAYAGSRGTSSWQETPTVGPHWVISVSVDETEGVETDKYYRETETQVNWNKVEEVHRSG